MYGERIVEDLVTEKELYRHLLNQFEEEMKHMPEGGLNSKAQRGKTYYYQYLKTKEGKRIQRYLSKDEDHLKAVLKRKRFIQLSINRIRMNLKTIDVFINTFCPYDPAEILSMLPKTYEGLDYRVGNEFSDNYSDWMNAEYEKSELYPEALIYGTVGGLKVRSKSESIIAGLLENHNIPFRYEAALKIDNRIYYPDFTILRPKDNKILYWEHLGMIEDDDYISNAERKLFKYIRNGIVPWNQLITTYETEKAPIDARDIQSIIKSFILQLSFFERQSSILIETISKV